MVTDRLPAFRGSSFRRSALRLAKLSTASDNPPIRHDAIARLACCQTRLPRPSTFRRSPRQHPAQEPSIEPPLFWVTTE